VITDQYIINEFFANHENRKNLMIKRKRLDNASEEEIKYIRDRYSDSESDSESLKRIYYGIENKPKCPVCGKSIKFIGIPSCMFKKFCSNKCAQISIETRNKSKETCLKRYGVINGGGSKRALDKIKKTCQEKYGVDWVGQIPSQKQHVKETFDKKYGGNPNKTIKVRNKLKETCLKRYGVINGGGSKQALDKIKKTCQEKYGVDWVFSSKEIQNKIWQTNIKRYGYPTPCQCDKVKYKLRMSLNSEEVKSKIYNTKKRNNSFNKSTDEDLSYIYISELYPDVQRQVKYSKDRNYIADFYIPCLDLYIECDYHWTHGGHVYDKTNVQDITKVKLWDSKNTKYYNNAINTWTKKDVEKRKFIESLKLNCLYFYNIKELINWLNGE
jgi:predicted nucleic acid-binding Zn ribbon protein